MKNLLTTFLIVCFAIISEKMYSQVTGTTFISGTEWTAKSKPTVDGNIISLSFSSSGPYDYYLTKLTSDGDIIWSNGFDGPSGYSNLNDIFGLPDGNYVMFNEHYFVKFNSEGLIISDFYLTSESLGYDPIPGDAGTVNYADVEQVGGEFIFFSRGYAAGDYFVVITKLDEDGNSIWSYAFNYDFYYNYALIVKDEYVFLSSVYWYPDDTRYLIKINSLDGSVVSETATSGTLYDIDLIDVDDGIIESSKGYSLDLDVDMITKYDYNGDTLWTNQITYSDFDSCYLIEMIKLESGNLISVNYYLDAGGESEYFLRYYDDFGDTILHIHNFLDAETFDIKDMERDGDHLIFSGKYDGLLEEIGFVLITDTLGQFNKLVVQGTVYYDENDNGIVDPDEFTFHDRLISSEPSGYYAFTNSEGEYSMFIYEPGIYAINTESPLNWDVVDPSEYAVEYDPLGLEDTLFDKDFRLNYTVPVMDLRATLIQTGIVPGFATQSSITVENIGNQIAVDATAYLNHPSGLTYDTGTPYTDYTDTIISWDLTEFNPYDPIIFQSYFIASIDLEIGDIKLTVGSIETIGDYLIANNTDSVFTTVAASFDPNHKTVNPAGISDEGYIDPNTEWLEYTVEFQNVGTAPATFVYINDVIDTHLDLSSIEILGADHTYWMEVSEENTITWHFDNINLPDSASDPAGSCGFVTYKIKVNEDAEIGTVITNTAYIYFDYNPAVITNTTKTTLELPNSIQEFNKYLNVYPNPAGDYIILQLEEENTSGCNIKIYNINGEVVLDEVLDAGKQMIQINSANFPNGIYFINCSDAEGILTTNAKFIVAH